jgi:hypothetical protein
MQFDELTRDIKAEPGAFIFSLNGAVNLFKGVEYIFEIFRRESDPGILDADPRPFPSWEALMVTAPFL